MFLQIFCSLDFSPLRPAMVRATKKQVSKVKEDESTKKKTERARQSAMVRAPRKSRDFSSSLDYLLSAILHFRVFFSFAL
jgi:hypothetical protein